MLGRRRSRRDPHASKAQAKAQAKVLLARAKRGDAEAAHVLVDAAALAGAPQEAVENLLLALQGRATRETVTFSEGGSTYGRTISRGELVPSHLRRAVLSYAIDDIRRALFPPRRAPAGIRMPSTARLVAAFRDLDRPTASLMRRIAKAADEPDDLMRLIRRVEPTARYVNQLHHSPYESAMWRRTVVLHALDVLLGTAGVEPLGPISAFRGPPYEYLNAGDTYVATLIFSRDADAITIGSWGDIAERHPEWE